MTCGDKAKTQKIEDRTNNVKGVELEEEKKEAQIFLCACKNGMYIVKATIEF